MSYIDDDDYLFRPALPARDRHFINGNDDSAANREAWAAAILSTAAGDAPAMARAFERVAGQIAPLNTRGNPRRNSLAKAVMSLRSNPDAWARLRRAGARFELDDDLATQDSDWLPSTVDLVDYMWAANPAALGEAAKEWRHECERKNRWWSCPFLSRYWNGPIEIKPFLSQEAKRLFPNHATDDKLPDSADGLGAQKTADTVASRVERDALASILTQTARACIGQLWSHEKSAIDTRAAGGTVWSRGGSEWGLEWLLPHLDWTEPADKPEPKALMRQPDASARAVDEAMAEALAQSPESGSHTARMIALSLSDHQGGGLSLRALRALDADPLARALPIPFGPHDWMGPRVVARIPASDEKLAQWLAEVGVHWSAPASHRGNFGTSSRSGIVPGHPRWSYQADQGGPPSPLGLDQWSMLEWMPLMGRSVAARRACQLGATLHPSFERAIGAPVSWNFSTSRAEAIAIAEACRIAEASAHPALLPVPAKRL